MVSFECCAVAGNPTLQKSHSNIHLVAVEEREQPTARVVHHKLFTKKIKCVCVRGSRQPRASLPATPCPAKSALNYVVIPKRE